MDHITCLIFGKCFLKFRISVFLTGLFNWFFWWIKILGASTDNLPPGVLYRVKATYKYNREDVDELSFDVGEIIQVTEYEDPEEQAIISVLFDYF